jgi:4-hydroxybenzoate polyprenyltransferase
MLSRLRTYASFVRFSHSVFALPFALTGALLASRRHEVNSRQIFWIVADATNPRTAARELPRGTMSRLEAICFVVIASLAFIFCTYQLSPLCLTLSPLALGIVFWYSLAKRFTWSTQLFLGLAMAVAPVGGWLAAGGRGGLEPWLLALAIGLWVGGFDVLYACQDLAVDHAQGLKSIPVRFGIARSLVISRVMHVGAVLSLASLALIVPLGWVYLAGVAAVATLLLYEQSLVTPQDLSRVKQAFDLNGYVGILYFIVTAISLYVA